jgi:hypothetical protein
VNEVGEISAQPAALPVYLPILNEMLSQGSYRTKPNFDFAVLERRKPLGLWSACQSCWREN